MTDQSLTVLMGIYVQSGLVNSVNDMYNPRLNTLHL